MSSSNIKTIEEVFKELSAPFPSSEIQWKAGRVSECGCWATPIPFLTARAIQRRLDEVFGPMNWKNSFHEVVTGPRISAIRCALSVRVDGEWNTKEDGAHVEVNGRPEFAIKGAYSDAEKRAAVQWGIGRYLYSLDLPLLPCTTYGKGQNMFTQLSEVPLLPPSCLAEAEKEAGTKAWDEWMEKIRQRDEELERQRVEFEAKQAARALARSQAAQDAMDKVEQVANNAVTTHLPSTDAFSLREPLVSREAKPQVAEGEAPRSVSSLLGDDGNSRAAATPHACASASGPLVGANAIAPDDLPDAGVDAAAVVHANTSDSATGSAPQDATATYSAGEAAVVAEPEPRKPARTRNSSATRDAAREKVLLEEAAEAANVAARVAVAEAVAPSTVDAPVSAPAVTTAEPATAVPTAAAAPALAPAKAADKGERVVSSLVKPDSPLADCDYVLSPEDDWVTFRDVLTKIRMPDAALAIMERFVQGPRTKNLLTEATRQYLQSEIDRLRTA